MRLIRKDNGFQKAASIILILFLLLSLTWSYAGADENGLAGRKVFEQYQNGLVSLKTVAKIRMVADGKERFNKEIEAAATATLIDASGLVVTSASMVNPGQTMEKQMRNFSARAGQGNTNIAFNVELLSISMILPDGKEIPMESILRDKDLDLIFLRPVKKLGAPVFAVDFTRSGSADTLDPVVILDLLPKEYYGRKPQVALDRVGAVVEKPRKFYLLGNQHNGSLGLPVFTLDGKVLGITVAQIPNTLPVVSALEQMSGSSDTTGGVTVAIPAADILDIARQIPAPETK